MDILKPEGSFGEASVRYKRPEFAHEFHVLTIVGYTNVKPVLEGGQLP